MKTAILLKSGALALSLISTGCASTSQSSSERNMILGEDGTFTIVDENGNAVEDENLELLGKLLSQGMAEAMEQQELKDDEIWAVDQDGNLTHIQSGGICPQAWGEFSLVKTSIFKRDGSDVGCNFQSASLNASYTFYFYKNHEPIEQDLESVITAIQSRNPTAKETDLTYLIPEPRFYIGRVIETVIDGGGVKRDASLIADEAGWRIKLRMTYGANNAVEHEQLGALMLQGQVDRVGYDTIGVNPEHNETPPQTDV
ncbi:MAG: hypothetical protein AAFV59_11125 [Pseudomonadota bacterium]